MTKYNIFFGKDFSNIGQIDSFDTLYSMITTVAKQLNILKI